MSIVGFNLEKISVEKVKPIRGGVQVKNNVSVKDVEQQEILLSNKKEPVLKFTFEFSSSYEPKIGKILMQGHILYMESPQEIKKIMANWKKNKKIQQKIMGMLLNTVLMRCNIKALILAQDVNLPPHLKLPTISPKVNASEYIG